MDFGTVLRNLRKSRHLTLEAVSRQAGISRVTLNRWERGTHQPRLTELEAVLKVLEASPKQRRQAMNLLDAPRAKTLIREEIHRIAEQRDLGPMPQRGDLLRTMRHRRGISQEVLAQQIGVSARTLHRWEYSEAWPTVEQLHALCFALKAHEAEVIALTVGRFAPQSPPSSESSSLEGIRARLRQLKALENRLPLAIEELGYLALEADAWPLALHRAEGQTLLADICCMYANFLQRLWRYDDAKRYGERAMELYPEKARTTPNQVIAGTIIVTSPIHRTRRPAKKWELDHLRFWLSEAQPWPHLISLVQSKIFCSFYAERASEAALQINREAIQSAERTEDPVILHQRQWGRGEVLLQQGRPQEALSWLAEAEDDFPCLRIRHRMLLARAYLALNQRSHAHDFLEKVFCDIHTHQLEQWRAEATALEALL